MRKDDRWSLLSAVLAPCVGVALGNANVIGPNPQTFFGLGVLATIAVSGIVYGVREGLRLSREAGSSLSN